MSAAAHAQLTTTRARNNVQSKGAGSHHQADAKLARRLQFEKELDLVAFSARHRYRVVRIVLVRCEMKRAARLRSLPAADLLDLLGIGRWQVQETKRVRRVHLEREADGVGLFVLRDDKRQALLASLDGHTGEVVRAGKWGGAESKTRGNIEAGTAEGDPV